MNKNKTYYSLRIWVSEEESHKIDGILGVNTNQSKTTWWTLEYFVKENENNFDFANYFLDLLNNKFDKLKEIGVERKDISIWYVYYYDGQCNMEFSPKQMYKLGKGNIGFCISCVDVHDYDADNE